MNGNQQRDFGALMASLSGESSQSLARQFAALARAASSTCCRQLVDFLLAEVDRQVALICGSPNCGMNADVGWVYENLGRRALLDNNDAEAEDCFRRAISLYSEQHSDPARAAAVMRDLAVMMEAQERLADAEDLRQQAVEIDEMACGVDTCIRDLRELGDLLYREHKYAEAEEPYQQAIELAYMAWGECDQRALDIIEAYAACRIRLGREDHWRDLQNYRAALGRGSHGQLFAVRPTHLLPHFADNDGVMLRDKLRRAQETAAAGKPAETAATKHGHAHK